MLALLIGFVSHCQRVRSYPAVKTLASGQLRRMCLASTGMLSQHTQLFHHMYAWHWMLGISQLDLAAAKDIG